MCEYIQTTQGFRTEGDQHVGLDNPGCALSISKVKAFHGVLQVFSIWV